MESTACNMKYVVVGVGSNPKDEAITPGISGLATCVYSSRVITPCACEHAASAWTLRTLHQEHSSLGTDHGMLPALRITFQLHKGESGNKCSGD